MGEFTTRQANRRAFLKKGAGAAGATALGAGLFTRGLRVFGDEEQGEGSGSLTKGDAAILRFLAAAEIIESDLWLQYAELGGAQTQPNGNPDNELPGLPTGGNTPYTLALQKLDGDMPQYIHDNTEDEFSHQAFINAYLASKGADQVSLDQFKTLKGSIADGVNTAAIGKRITNLTELTVDTSWWGRYRSRDNNPRSQSRIRVRAGGAGFGQRTVPSYPERQQRSDSRQSHPGDRQHRGLSLLFHRAGRQQPLSFTRPKSDPSRGSPHPAEHRSD